MRHDISGMTVPEVSTIHGHKSMYKRRAKLRDIMHVVDRHSTGAMPREKFHLCLELASLPVPDAQSEQAMYGKFLNREMFRYGEFLECMKYDPAYRHLLTSRWRRADPALAQMQSKPRGAGLSLTPDPGSSSLLPPIAKSSQPGGLRSRIASRSSSAAHPHGNHFKNRLRQAFVAFDKSRSGTVTIEQLQQGLVALNLVPATSNAVMLDVFKSCDRDGNGNIDYDRLCRVIQDYEASGQPLFVPGYGSSAGGSRQRGRGQRQLLARSSRQCFND